MQWFKHQWLNIAKTAKPLEHWHNRHLNILTPSQSQHLTLKNSVWKVFVQNRHLVYSLNVIRLWPKRMKRLNVLVLWLQGVVEHLQSCGLVMFCKIPAGQRKLHGLESALFGCWNNFAAQQEWGEKRELTAGCGDPGGPCPWNRF